MSLTLNYRLSPPLEQENELALSYILGDIQSVTASECALKVVVVSLCQLLLSTDLPLVGAKYCRIIQAVIQLLSHTNHANPHTWMIDAEAEEDERYFGELIEQTQNRIKDTNEHRYFKETVGKVSGLALFRESLGRLSPEEQTYLGRVMNAERVNQGERVIVRVRRE